MALVVIIGIAFVIGVPLVAVILRNIFNGKVDKNQTHKIGRNETVTKKNQSKEKQVNTLPIRIILVLVIVLLVISIAVKIFDAVFPDFE